MASLAAVLASLNDAILVDIVEANEFPEISMRYGIRGVPTSVLDESLSVVGAQPPQQFLATIKEHVESQQNASANLCEDSA